MFNEDLGLFLDTADFAQDVTIDGTAAVGIFENQWVEVTIGGVPYSGVHPTLLCKSTDVAGKLGKTAVISSTNYTIVDIRPDGTGLSLVILMKQ